MTSVILLIVLAVSSLWTILIIRSAVSTMHSAGKTYSQRQGVKRGYSWLQRLFLVHVRDSTAGMPKYNKYRSVLEKFLLGYMIACAVIWLCIIVGIFVPRFNVVIIVIMSVKALLVDILGVSFYLYFNTVKDKKHGTINWKWSKEPARKGDRVA